MYESENNTNMYSNFFGGEISVEELAKQMQEEMMKTIMDNSMEVIKTNPEVIPVIVKAMMEKYKPIVYECCNELFQVYKDYVNNKEVALVSAQARKNMFDAYVEVGFTEEQAWALMTKDVDTMKKVIEQMNEVVKNVSKDASKNTKKAK